MDDFDWRERKSAKVFESVLFGLENHRRSDPSFTLAEAQGTLDHLYISEGNDWLGRGEVGDLEMSATIAAYEHFIHDWKTASFETKNATGEP